MVSVKCVCILYFSKFYGKNPDRANREPEEWTGSSANQTEYVSNPGNPA